MQQIFDSLPPEEQQKIKDQQVRYLGISTFVEFYFEVLKAVVTFVVFIILHQIFRKQLSLLHSVNGENILSWSNRIQMFMAW